MNNLEAAHEYISRRADVRPGCYDGTATLRDVLDAFRAFCTEPEQTGDAEWDEIAIEPDYCGGQGSDEGGTRCQ